MDSTTGRAPLLCRGNIARWVALGARSHPHRSALEMWEGEVRTYADLDERSNRLANALLGSGLRPGSRVAVWLGNCLEYLDVYIAAAKAGLVLVPINVRFTAEEAAQILGDADVQALVFGPETAGVVETLGAAAPLLVSVGTAEAAGSRALEALVRAGAPSAPDVAAGGDDLLVVGYTSGTTGVPKGAMLTHASMENVGLTNALACRYRLGSVHVFGMSLSFTATVPAHVLPHLFVGGTTILHRTWDTEALVECIARRRANFAIVPSPALRDMAAAWRARPGSADSLGSVLHSASKAPAEDIADVVGVLGERLVEGWGMTEASGGLITASAPDDLVGLDPVALASAGRPVPGTQVRVVDENGEELRDPSEIGHLYVSSGSLFRGYWRDDAATAAAFADGWFRTGDLGSRHENGLVTLHDRRQDLINSGGMNVYPSEIERVLMASGLVRECAVVAGPHERWGQVPVAFVVATADATPDQLTAWAAARLANYKRPARVEWVEALPRNTGGKIERRRLAERAGERACERTDV